MKVIFHPRFHEVYAHDPAAVPGRMDAIVKALAGVFDFIEPEACSGRDLEAVHGRQHIRSVEEDPLLFEIASLAAGGAVLAGAWAFRGEPAFGLVRPPGHHASPHSCWGFCYFNNVAIAIRKLLREQKITSALILDFDLHFGDGTANIFDRSPEVRYVHPGGANRDAYLQNLQQSLHLEKDYDMIAVSAGFDRHEEDWGGLLKTEDYFSIGEWAKVFSQEHCEGRRFGVLEGGYHQTVLGKNVKGFLKGFSD